MPNNSPSSYTRTSASGNRCQGDWSYAPFVSVSSICMLSHPASNTAFSTNTGFSSLRKQTVSLHTGFSSLRKQTVSLHPARKQKNNRIIASFIIRIHYLILRSTA